MKSRSVVSSVSGNSRSSSPSLGGAGGSRTKGVEVGEFGHLLSGFRRADGSFTPSTTLIPEAFWARLKRLVTLAHRMDEFQADAKAFAQRERGFDLEIVMFRLWVGKLGIKLPPGHYDGELLWPWSRGWTPELVDSYLLNPDSNGGTTCSP